MAREYEIEDLARYRRDIDAVTQRACTSFRRDAMAVASRYGDPASWTRGDKAEIRDAVASLMSAHVDAHSAATQALASGLVEDILEAQGEGTGVEVVERDMAHPASKSARYWYRRLDEGDIDGFVAGCESFVERSVSHAGDMSLLDGAFGRKGKARLRYARVPSGPTCPFCLMLASRGFAYVTPESAGQLGKFHDRCDCRIVAGHDGLKVKGYDPEGMRARIKACRDAIGSPSDVLDDFAALPQAEKARYGRGGRAYDARLPEELVERIGENSNAFDDYYFQRIMAEMGTRDRGWLYDGTPCKVAFEKGAKSLDKEFDTARILRDNGFNVEFIKEANRTGVKTADARLNGTIWEFKVPEGWNGEHTIRKQFYKAEGKGTDSLVISSISNDAPVDVMAGWVKATFRKGDYPYIRQVLVVGKDGRIVRVIR